MTIWLILVGFLGIAAAAFTSDYSGRLAVRLQLYGGLLAGCSFALVALLFLFQEPWKPALILSKEMPLHGASAVFALIMQAAIYAGPQLTGLAFAGVAYYILRSAWITYHVRSR